MPALHDLALPAEERERRPDQEVGHPRGGETVGRADHGQGGQIDPGVGGIRWEEGAGRSPDPGDRLAAAAQRGLGTLDFASLNPVEKTLS